MVTIAAWWGLGYAALLVATVIYGWHTAQEYAVHRQRQPRADVRATWWTGQALTAISTILLWVGLWSRARTGHGWPFVSSADVAAGIALLLLLLYVTWSLIWRGQKAGFVVSVIALVLLSYGLGRFPRSPVTSPLTSTASLLSSVLNLCGGSLLALASATSLTHVVRARYAGTEGATHGTEERMSEVLVRTALLCLAVNLAIDTWWLQKVGLGTESDVQQAGIAVAWMVYFVALRLRSSPQWRGWPWASILTVGFICILPILLNVPWLDNRLLI